MEKNPEVYRFSEPDSKRDAWIAILSGLAASGELSPENLGKNGGDARVKTLTAHAAGLALNFAAEYDKRIEQ